MFLCYVGSSQCTGEEVEQSQDKSQVFILCFCAMLALHSALERKQNRAKTRVRYLFCVFVLCWLFTVHWRGSRTEPRQESDMIFSPVFILTLHDAIEKRQNEQRQDLAILSPLRHVHSSRCIRKQEKKSKEKNL